MHWHRQGNGLAVDAHWYPVGLAAHHDGAGGQHPQASGVPAAQQAHRLPGTVHQDRHHPEDTAVKPRPAAKASDVTSLVGVARHQQRLRCRDRLAVRDRGKPGAPVPLKQVGQRVQGGSQLVVTVGRGLHHFGVGAERHVVDERPPVDHPEVDALSLIHI